MKVFTSAAELRAWSTEERALGARIGLVPTMGALHAGHLSLVAHVRPACDRVVASIFVNPTQFAPNEDLERYPRPLAQDLRLLQKTGVDAVFTPDLRTMYPEGFDTYVVPEVLAKGLCGGTRPHHFRGVCTVVLLLCRISLCHVAVFGQKDYQQWRIIQQMARDLWLEVLVLRAPTVREPDGLAMSSRNLYLTKEERAQAPSLYQAVRTTADSLSKGSSVAAARAAGCARISQRAKLEYLELVHPDTLAPLEAGFAGAEALVAAAMWLGQTRLIDNTLVTI